MCKHFCFRKFAQKQKNARAFTTNEIAKSQHIKCNPRSHQMLNWSQGRTRTSNFQLCKQQDTNFRCGNQLQASSLKTSILYTVIFTQCRHCSRIVQILQGHHKASGSFQSCTLHFVSNNHIFTVSENLLQALASAPMSEGPQRRCGVPFLPQNQAGTLAVWSYSMSVCRMM